MKKQYSVLLILLLLPFLSVANSDEAIFVKTKSIKKTYLVYPDAGINIDNSYGNIYVTTWDEDKIELEVNIKVSGSNEGWVNQRINEIDIDINALKHLISAKTILGNTNFKTKGSSNSFEINYTIKVPKKGNVTLRNKYGNISTSDLWSPTEIYCKYGKLITGKLYSTKNTIQIEYCPNSQIDYLNNGAITARYSGLRINSLSKIDLLSDYTDTTILEGDFVQYSSKYGTLNIEKVKSTIGSANYMKLNLGEISGATKLTAKYCEIAIDYLTAKANDVTIIAAYSNIKIGYSSNFDFNFDISARYATIKHENDLNFSSKEETTTNKTYRGYFSKKDANNLSIKSDYGNIHLFKK
tara:strand:- start:267 stop:1328 length:1062 start_codon:yes stop_codon:yes gene_type:complete